MFAHTDSVSAASGIAVSSADPRTTTLKPETKDRKKIMIVSAAAVAALLLVIGGIFIVTSSRDTGGGGPASQPPTTAEAQQAWKPIAQTRVLPATGWQPLRPTAPFGFSAASGRVRVSGGHEGYDPAIDSWKGGEGSPSRFSMRCR